MKKNIKTKTHNLYKIIFLFVVFLGIGYAFLEANLNINGDVTVEAPEFNTYVQSTSVTSGSTTGTPTIIGNDKKEVDFTTALTNDGNSFFEETTTLVNKGSKKAYIRNIDVKVYDSNNNEITLSAPYEYTLTHGDGTAVDSADEIAINGTKTYKLKFNYISGTDMTTVTDYPTYTFKIIYNFKKDIIDLPTGKTKDNLEVGDEICIKGECFNFIRYDNDDIVMLAKWNLNVGPNAKGTPTNKQDSEVRGFTQVGDPIYGDVLFSYTNYWDDNGSPKSDYPGSYSEPDFPSVYDLQYKVEPDFSNQGFNTTGYSIAYYVDKYKDILEDYNAPIKNIRLLTFTEALSTSNEISSLSIFDFLTKTSFWLESAYDDMDIFYVAHNTIYYIRYNVSNSLYGVRPVIVISKSNI